MNSVFFLAESGYFLPICYRRRHNKSLTLLDISQYVDKILYTVKRSQYTDRSKIQDNVNSSLLIPPRLISSAQKVLTIRHWTFLSRPLHVRPLCPSRLLFRTLPVIVPGGLNISPDSTACGSLAIQPLS